MKDTYKTLTEDQINELIAFKQCKIIMPSYNGRDAKYTFIDLYYGEFICELSTMLKNRWKRHPKHKKDPANRLDFSTDENINTALRQISDFITIKPNQMLIGNKIRYTFVDSEYGEFIAKIDKVLYRGKRHPDRSKKERKENLRKYHSANEINDILIASNRNCRLVTKEITGKDDEYTFLDDEYGEFITTIGAILRGHDHPKRGRKKANETILEKYGVSHYSKHPNYAQQCKNTYMERYGVEHNMKHPQMALANAKARNKYAKIIHWQTKEECICVGSYEEKVLEYLNAMRVSYIWQPKAFKLSSSSYIPDLYLINENKYIEIKGWLREDAKEKWNEFINLEPNSEMWNKDVLKNKGFKFKNGKCVDIPFVLDIGL